MTDYTNQWPKNMTVYPTPEQMEGRDWPRNKLPNGMTALETYTRVWADSRYGRKGRRYGILERLLRVMDEDKRHLKTVLDVGCGRCVALDIAIECGFASGRGCDIVDVANRDNFDLIETAAKLPYKSGSFDLVLMVDVIEHLQPEGEWEEAIFECVRVAKHGALFSVHTGLDGWGPALNVGHLHIMVKDHEFWRAWFDVEFPRGYMGLGTTSTAAWVDDENEKNLWILVEKKNEQ